MNNWFKKLQSSLSKTSDNFGLSFKKAFALNKPNKEILHDIEDILISSDLGVKFSNQVVSQLSKKNFQENISKVMVIECVVNEITSKLAPFSKELVIPNIPSTYTIVFSGINGSGKTLFWFLFESLT